MATFLKAVILVITVIFCFTWTTILLYSVHFIPSQICFCSTDRSQKLYHEFSNLKGHTTTAATLRNFSQNNSHNFSTIPDAANRIASNENKSVNELARLKGHTTTAATLKKFSRNNLHNFNTITDDANRIASYDTKSVNELAVFKNATILSATSRENDKFNYRQGMEYVKNGMFINQNVNTTDAFKYVYSNSDLCTRNVSHYDNVFLLIMVLTAPGETSQRDAIRSTWANVTHVLGRRVATIFLLGNSSNGIRETLIAKENDAHRDICKKDFRDSYRNLTLKTMMGLRWVNSFCNNTKFVLKIDSDTIPNLHRLIQHLNTLTDKTVFEGFLLIGRSPVRDNSTWIKKWFVSKDLYPHPTYPPYVNGPSYLISSNVVKPAVSVSKHIPYIPVEDAYFGMLMKTIGVAPKHEERFTQRRMTKYNSTHDALCFFSKTYTVHSTGPKELQKLWTAWKDFDSHKCANGTTTFHYF